MSDSLQPHELWRARPPRPSVSPGVCSDSCPLTLWCHPTISPFCCSLLLLPSIFPASGSFPMSRLFASGGQSIGASASASVFPVNIYMYILFQIPFHYRVWQDSEYHPLCYTVGLCYLPVWYIVEYICQLQFFNLSPPCHCPLWLSNIFYVCESIYVL